MGFSAEERARIVAFQMRDRGIKNFAELARLSRVDRGNLSLMISSGKGLGPELLARVADVLRLPRDQVEHLFAEDFSPDIVTVKVGIDVHGPELGKFQSAPKKFDEPPGMAWRGTLIVGKAARLDRET